MLPRSWWWLNVSAWLGAMAFLAAPLVASAQSSSQKDEPSETASPSASARSSPSNKDKDQPAEGPSETKSTQGDRTGASASADKRDTNKSEADKDQKKAEPEFVRKSYEQWKRELPPTVFMVTRQAATEPPFSGKYATGHFRGIFICACCEAELFDARHKFESGTGWPSFWRPISMKAVVLALDNSRPGEPRLEARCRRCGAHLGHRFSDNPAAPTGWRFCINTLSLKLKSPSGRITSPVSKRARSKTKGRVKARTTRRSASGTRSRATSSTDQAPRATTSSEKSSSSTSTNADDDE